MTPRRSLAVLAGLMMTLGVAALVPPAGAQSVVEVSGPLLPPATCGLQTSLSDVEIRWDPVANTTGYDIWRNGAVIDTTGVDPYYVDSQPPAGELHYSVASRNAEQVTWRRYCGFTTVFPQPDTERPSIPGPVNVSEVTETSATFAWRPAQDNVGVVAYNIYLNGGFVQRVVGDPTAPEVTLNGLTPGTDFWAYVRAVDAAGNIGWRTGYRSFTTLLAGVDNQRPSIPARGITLDGEIIRWGVSTDNVAVAKYLVFDADTGAIVAESNETSVRLESGSWRIYAKAEDTSGNRSWRTAIATIHIPAS